MHQLIRMMMVVFVGIGGLAASPVAAQKSAHVHGVGELNLAVDGNKVLIELTAPGADIVGFEHRPSTKADRQAVRDAVGKLKNASALFVFPKGAGCILRDAEVHAEQMEKDHHGHHGHHGDGDHAEFRGEYKYHCGTPAALSHIEVLYFKAFPRAHELEARTITPKGQGKTELTAASPRLTF